MRWGARIFASVVLPLVGCGRTPVGPFPESSIVVPAQCPVAEDELLARPVNPRVQSCNELSENERTFGCYGDGDCERFVVDCIPEHEHEHGEGPYACCSDDPSTFDGRLPAFEGRGIPGSEPMVAGIHNALSTTGACVRVDETVDGLREAEAEGCPVPCNPHWTELEVETVCGVGKVCCQTKALQAKDCILDDADVCRPVRGTDIHGYTRWAPASHATHQNPNGDVCLTLTGGDATSPRYRDCIDHLTVADQRGFCTPRDNCCSSASYADVCEEEEACGR